MMKRTIVAALALTLLIGASGPAAAHEHEDILDGKYEITLGWKSEPPFAGVKNGLDLRVERYVDGGEHGEDDGHGHGAREQEPVTDMIGNMTVTYEYAGRTFEPVNLRGAFGTPGAYTAEITPTRPGAYTVHVKGTIEGEAFEVSIQPETVRPVQDTMFPAEDPTAEDLQMEIDALKEELATLQQEVDALQTQAQQNANDPADTTPSGDDNRTPGPGALLVALGAVGAALVIRRR